MPESPANNAQPAASMHLSVSKELALDILNGKWKIGDNITLEDIQNRFHVSRTVAREVAKYLESMGAVAIKRRVGIVACPVPAWSSLNPQVIQWKLHSSHRVRQLRSLTELRLAIEPAAAADAAINASLEEKAMFPVIATQMATDGEAGKLEEFHELDIRFHTLLLSASGNELFASLAEIISTVIRGRVELGMYPSRPAPEALSAHQAVAEAIWKGRPDDARQAMQRIVDEVAEDIQPQP